MWQNSSRALVQKEFVGKCMELAFTKRVEIEKYNICGHLAGHFLCLFMMLSIKRKHQGRVPLMCAYIALPACPSPPGRRLEHRDLDTIEASERI